MTTTTLKLFYSADRHGGQVEVRRFSVPTHDVTLVGVRKHAATAFGLSSVDLKFVDNGGVVTDEGLAAGLKTLDPTRALRLRVTSPAWPLRATDGTAKPAGPLLVHGARVVLKSLGGSERSLRIMHDGSVNGLGGRGRLAQFEVIAVAEASGTTPAVVQLRNIFRPTAFLRLTDDGDLDGRGIQASVDTHFKVVEHGEGVVSLRRGNLGVGIVGDGSAKAGKATGTGSHGRFRVEPIVDAKTAKAAKVKTLPSPSASDAPKRKGKAARRENKLKLVAAIRSEMSAMQQSFARMTELMCQMALHSDNDSDSDSEN
eukprot:m.284968 g.284968  ORF g.284968 m.284968 type:complete len:314 (-) comp19429_c1_seq3:126-1067(-)